MYLDLNRPLINFNKEIFAGEIGALISAPLGGWITSLFTLNNSYISSVAVLSSLAGASLFWILMRAYDEKRAHVFTMQHLATDIGYFTPGAFVLAMSVYYPSLFLMSRHLLTQDYRVVSSVILSQAIAFTLYLVAMNIYRYLLWKFTQIEL